MRKINRICSGIILTVTLMLAVSFVSCAESYPNVEASASNGYTGWSASPDGTWKYLVDKTNVKGWQTIGPHWYYFKIDGTMMTGWQYVDTVLYHFAETSVEGHPLGSLYEDSAVPSGASGGQVAPDGSVIQDTVSTPDAATPDAASTPEGTAVPVTRANPYGHTCVEVDITNQTVYVYQGENLVLSSPCVTGMKGSRDTTPGNWAIRYKERDTYLTGPTWRSHVDFWMPFHGGMGLHDANWRGTSHSNFGGQIYVTDGSHGCVNLPHDVAEQLFNIAYDGMPVHVHL